MSSEPGPPPTSPAWKRPTDLMKKRCKRRAPSTSERAPLRPFNTVKSPTRSPQSSPARKRRNPFTCSPNRKRLNLGPENDDLNADSDFLLFQMLDKADNAFSPPSKLEASLPSKSIDKLDDLEATPDQNDEETVEAIGQELMPLDWSLKTKIRFISSTPFSWSGPMKAQDEANGVSLYVRKGDLLPFTDSGVQAELKSATMYWVHPNIPWLNLYPRQVQDSRVGKPSVAVLDEHMIGQLHRDWTQSFTSLYNLLKANVCPYFYVLSYQFSAFFRSAGVCGVQSAMLTPTTRGFREAVSSEGIRFTMPLAGGNDSQHSEAASSASSMDDDIHTSDTGASSFLESIGVDKGKFPELNPEKVKMEREDYKRIDSRPESLIQVEDDETKQLFNYLLNCRSCIANTGVQRGIPPTLLAPVAFNGATLKPMQLKQGTVRQTGADSAVVKMFTLEVNGALLPDNVARLCDLLSRTQSAYTASLSTHEPTQTYNDVPIAKCRSYYQPSEDSFLGRARGQCENCVRSVEFRHGLYHCSSS